MSDASEPYSSHQVNLVWPEQQPKASPANQFALSFGLPTSKGLPDAVYLSIGHAEPPLFPMGDQSHGTDDQVTTIPIDVMGRYVFTRSRLSELMTLLTEAMAVFDQATGGETDGTYEAGKSSE